MLSMLRLRGLRPSSALTRAIDASQAIIEFKMDGTVLAANQNFLSAFGYGLAEVKGKHHAMFLPPGEEQSPGYRAFWERLRAGTFQSAEYLRVGKHGKEVWIRASYNPILGFGGQPLKVVKLATVVTAEKLLSADFQSKIEAINRSQAVIEFALDGSILDANDHFLALMGYDLSEIRGKHHGIFVEPAEKDSHEYRRFWEALRRGEHQSAEYRRFGKSGREVWIRATYNPIVDPAGRLIKVVKFATDVTQEKLRNADFQGKIEAIGKSQAVIEFATDGTVVDANGNFLTTMGYTLDEIRGRHHSVFLAPGEEMTAEYRQFWDKLRAGTFQSAEYLRLGKGGRQVWIQATYNPIFDPAGRVLKVVKFATDITAEVARRAQIRLLSLVANETSNSVVITDAAGHIEYVNPGFERMTGFTFEEVRGCKPGAILQGPGTSPETVRKVREDLARRAPFYDEILNYTKDGRPYWISLSINPIIGQDGQLEQFVSIQANVTETKKLAIEHNIRLEAISGANAICEWSADGTLLQANSFLQSLGADCSGERAHLMTLLGSGGLDELLGKGQARCELLWPSVSGQGVWLDAILSVLCSIQGQPKKILLCATDATRRRRMMEQTDTALKEVVGASRRINDIIASITAISAQTNLLALNATIEAARAGDKGRGFAVVASEVRDLAGRTCSASAEIGNLVGESSRKMEILAESLDQLNTSTGQSPPQRVSA